MWSRVAVALLIGLPVALAIWALAATLGLAFAPALVEDAQEPRGTTLTVTIEGRETVIPGVERCEALAAWVAAQLEDGEFESYSVECGEDDDG